MSEQKPLYEAIIEELSKLNSVKIKSNRNGSSGLKNVHRFGEIIVGYKTGLQVKAYLGGLIKLKRQVSLASLEEIMTVLGQNPTVGKPFVIHDDSLMYSRLLGYADVNVPSDDSEYFIMKDLVAVRERPFFSLD